VTGDEESADDIPAVGPVPSRVPPAASIARWLIAGLLFMGVNTVALYEGVHYLHLSVAVATLASAEICTLLRYILNEIWVFKNYRMSWIKLWHYHVANAAALIVWWLAANMLNRLGVNYILSSIVAVVFSTGISFASNFFWIWRSKAHVTQEP
jgi:putative flippase GtrA